MTDDSNLPDIDLNISITEFNAKPRKLSTKWSSEAADGLRSLWGLRPVKTPLQGLAEGIDADDFEEWYEDWKKRQRTPEEALVDSMASEFKAMQDLRDRRTDLAIGNALESASRGEIYPTLHDEIMAVYRDKGIDEQERGVFFYDPSILK
jgi:hypothetical protein